MTPRSLRRFDSILPGGRQVQLSALDPAARAGRTIFGNRVVYATEPERLLKRGHHSRKIGDVVQKGKWRGMPIFTLTLEERATCPRTCKQWLGCYGNAMNWAERLVHGPELEARLWRELGSLQARNPGGFVVRLHVLGDFYSLAYVSFWQQALDCHPALRVFGYTAHDPAHGIGAALKDLADSEWERFALRFSGWGLADKGAEVFTHEPPAGAIPCPAQTGATDCCATCALCWQTNRPVAFRRH